MNEDVTVEDLVVPVFRAAIRVILLGAALEDSGVLRKRERPAPKIPYIRNEIPVKHIYYHERRMNHIYCPPRHIPRLENEYE